MSGRGSPCADRSGVWSRSTIGATRSTRAVGRRRTAMPVYCAAYGPVLRRRMCGDGADGEAHPCGAVLDEVDGELGAGVARADDEDVLAGVGRAVAVVARQDDLARVVLQAGHIRLARRVVEARRDDGIRRGERRPVTRASSVHESPSADGRRG